MVIQKWAGKFPLGDKIKTWQPVRIIAELVDVAAELCIAGTGSGCAVSRRALEEFFIIGPGFQS
jgi:hypothetical protein